MKLGNIPSYDEYIYRYRNFKNIGENRYYEFCKIACGIIKSYRKEVDKYCTDTDLLMDMVYQIYDHRHVSKKEY